MAQNDYRLSPECVLSPGQGGRGATLVHALYGSKFSLSAELLRAVVEISDGRPLNDVLEASPDGLRSAIETLIAEKVLVPPDELERLERASASAQRLDTIAHAVHRGLNEGGYLPDRVDHSNVPPSFKETMGTRSIALERQPALEPRMDLGECLARRRSLRAYSDRPLPQRTLGQFLHLSARAHALLETEREGTITMRNYPSGGARYPLELYPVVYAVEGVDPGIYHYHAVRHCLTVLPSAAEQRERLLTVVLRNMGQPVDPERKPALLFLVTAVFARTCWKYTGTPYPMILQEVGALYQTMYLTATLLGLAPCAVGAFPELAVAELLGLDPRDEAEVGLFVLGAPGAEAESSAARAVQEVRLRSDSPFAPDGEGRSVELRFGDGATEILDVAQVRLERGSDGSAVIPVRRGRRPARLSAADADRVTEWARPTA